MAIETPCINVCVIDQVTRQCAGCNRTIEEIAGWRALSDADRRRIIQELPGRRRVQQAAEG
jgi:predicted Fe-S protein YdhL (DUF1289 family)